jgi:hypothetical protein
MSEDDKAPWLLDHKSSRLFAAAAAIVVASGVFMFSLYLVSFKFPIERFNSSPIFVLVCIVVAVLTVPASLYILVGMVWYWMSLDSSPRLNKALWFLSFLAVAWYGASLYYYLVYRRQFSLLRESQLVI